MVSALRRYPHWRMLFIMLAAVALSQLTGLDQWIMNDPVSSTIYRVLAIMFFGVAGFFALTWNSTVYRLAGLLFLLIAMSHAAMLLTGSTNLTELFGE